MTYSDFIESIEREKPPENASPYLLALWHDARGDWEAAHSIVQDMNTIQAALIHAYLHRVEGDNCNADYWYRLVGISRPQTPLSSEWEELVHSLLVEER